LSNHGYLSEQNMKELKEYTAVITILLIGLGAFRILLFGEYYHISLWTFINFSNILAYTFDVLRGLIYYAPLVMFFVGFKSRFAPWLLSVHCCWYVSGAILSFGVCVIWYKYGLLTFETARWLKYLLLLSVFLVGIIIKQWDVKAKPWYPVVTDFSMIKLALTIGFLYCYLKIDLQCSIYNVNTAKKTTKSMLVLKNLNKYDTITTDSTKYVILSTAEYVFLHNESDSSTTSIPVSNVVSNTTNIQIKGRHP
jgi:hypothetical protein